MGDDSWDTNDVDDFHELEEGRDGRFDDDDRDDPSPSPRPVDQQDAKRLSWCPACGKKVEDLLEHFKELHPLWARAMQEGSASQ